MPATEEPTTRLLTSREELERLEPLWNSLREHYEAMEGRPGDVYSREQSWRRRRDTYEELLSDANGLIIALEIDSCPVAYAAVRVQPSSSVFTWSERTGMVETFVVDAERRGQGLGRHLLEVVRSVVSQRGADEITLHVVASNQEAIAFYEEVGFRRYCLLLSDALPTASSV